MDPRRLRSWAPSASVTSLFSNSASIVAIPCSAQGNWARRLDALPALAGAFSSTREKATDPPSAEPPPDPPQAVTTKSTPRSMRALPAALTLLQVFIRSSLSLPPAAPGHA
jgi:hypothetical protein